MAVTVKSVWGHVQRPWGYEVRVDFTDDATGAVYNECMTFPSEPAQAELDARVESVRQRVDLQMNPTPPGE